MSMVPVTLGNIALFLLSLGIMVVLSPVRPRYAPGGHLRSPSSWNPGELTTVKLNRRAHQYSPTSRKPYL